MSVKTKIGIQTTAREVSRGWEAALHTSPLLVTVLSEAGSRSDVRVSTEAGAVRVSSCNMIYAEACILKMKLM